MHAQNGGFRSPNTTQSSQRYALAQCVPLNANGGVFKEPCRSTGLRRASFLPHPPDVLFTVALFDSPTHSPFSEPFVKTSAITMLFRAPAVLVAALCASFVLARDCNPGEYKDAGGVCRDCADGSVNRQYSSPYMVPHLSHGLT